MRNKNFLNMLDCVFYPAEWPIYICKSNTKIINAKTIYKRAIQILLLPKMHLT